MTKDNNNEFMSSANVLLQNIDQIFISISLMSLDRSYSDWNDVLIMVSIGMAITIGILITLALCYIAREKCQKHREYYVTA